MCPRCAGYLIRDLGFQTITSSGPAYHCVNCGNYLDLAILRNQRLTLEERQAYAPKGMAIHSRRDAAYVLSGAGGVFLGHHALFSTL
jgi:hypothetical protein